MNQLDKKKKIWLLAYPAVIMATSMLLTYIFSEPFKIMKIGAYLFSYSIFLIYPLCFFSQGLLIRRYHENIGLGMGISALSFLLIIYISFQVSALAYAIFYAVIELVAYGLYYLYELFLKVKNQKK